MYSVSMHVCILAETFGMTNDCAMTSLTMETRRRRPRMQLSSGVTDRSNLVVCVCRLLHSAAPAQRELGADRMT